MKHFPILSVLVSALALNAAIAAAEPDGGHQERRQAHKERMQEQFGITDEQFELVPENVRDVQDRIALVGGLARHPHAATFAAGRLAHEPELVGTGDGGRVDLDELAVGVGGTLLVDGRGGRAGQCSGPASSGSGDTGGAQARGAGGKHISCL